MALVVLYTNVQKTRIKEDKEEDFNMQSFSGLKQAFRKNI